MSAKSNDDLSKALSLLMQTARSAQFTSRHTSRSSGPDIGDLFLAELKMRRAHLREWIDMLNREVDGESGLGLQPQPSRLARRACRGRGATS